MKGSKIRVLVCLALSITTSQVRLLQHTKALSTLATVAEFADSRRFRQLRRIVAEFCDYTVGHKKRATFIFTITLANLDRFE